MTRPGKSWGRQQPLTPRQRAALSDMDQLMRIRAMLDAGATVTPIGPRTILTLDTGGRGEFPTEAVDMVQRERLRGSVGA